MDRLEKRKNTKKEFSAGGVVIKGADVLLIGKNSGGKTIWAFPKGWIGDHGKETVEEAALREVREEGGVKAEIKGDLGEIGYFFIWEGVRIQKTVKYFLMEYISGDPAGHDFEVDEARFMPFDEADKLLTYKEDREILRKAVLMLG